MNVVVELPNGGTMDVECTPLLLEQVRLRYAIPSADEVTPDHIRRFIALELMTAIHKEDTQDA